MQERPEGLPANLSEKRRQIRELVLEYRKVLTETEYPIPEESGSVVVLSGPTLENNDSPQSVRSPENLERIGFAKEVFEKLTKEKYGLSLAELSGKEKSHTEKPLFVINAPTGQLEILKQAALEAGVPEDLIHLQDCLPREKANTATQFQAYVQDSDMQKEPHPLFISHSYHIPRLERTADALLPQEKNFSFLGVPYEPAQFKVYSRIRGEIKRVIAYSSRTEGGISKKPRAQKN